MENFVVSARKYRPQDFESVVGQSHITTTLKNAIKNNQLAHAFLFCGPRGVGKTTCARILAKTINCENISAFSEACNVCQSCRSFNEGTSFNIHELDGASNNTVEDMRSLIDQVRFVPQAGKYKVYIIDEVHMLSQSAFNAFLKTLEEPPPFAIFILATTEKHKIIPTILSRCQIFDFKRITIQDTVKHLRQICTKEGIEVETDALHLISQKSEGCMRDSLSILDKIVSFTNGHITYQNTLEHLNILDYDYFFKIMEAFLQQDSAKALLIFDEILHKGFESDNFLDGFGEFIRNLLVCKDDRVLHLMEVTPNLELRYKKMASQANTAFLIASLNILNDTSINYRLARNKRLHIEVGIIKLCYLLQAVQLISDEQTGEVHKKKVTDSQVESKKLRQAIPRLQVKETFSHLTEFHPLTSNSASKSREVKITGNPEYVLSESPIMEINLPKIDSSEKEKVKLTSLKSMKNQLNLPITNNAHSNILPLTDQLVNEKWSEFTNRFRKENKSTAANYFESAQLNIKLPNEIEIISYNIVQLRFIETEKLIISEFFKKEFQTPSILISMKIEDPGTFQIETPLPISGKEQLLRMIEKYPNVKDLKDKLNLEIDY